MVDGGFGRMNVMEGEDGHGCVPLSQWLWWRLIMKMQSRVDSCVVKREGSLPNK